MGPLRTFATDRLGVMSTFRARPTVAGEKPADRTGEVLDRSRRIAGLSHRDLWLRYFSLGGLSTALELEAYLYGARQPGVHDHDLIAHAINEHFVDMGGSQPAPYLEDDDNHE